MGAWIEIRGIGETLKTIAQSHPTMGAWIEIELSKQYDESVKVAPHDGCVD